MSNWPASSLTMTRVRIQYIVFQHAAQYSAFRGNPHVPTVSDAQRLQRLFPLGFVFTYGLSDIHESFKLSLRKLLILHVFESVSIEP